MRLAILALVLFAAAGPAVARDCSRFVNDRVFGQVIDQRDLFDCLLAEIRDLKREQARLKEIIARVEAVIGDLPVPYSNTDGVVTVEPGRPVGQADFTLTARQTLGAASLPLDQAVIETLCAKAGGCSITLFFRSTGFRASDPVTTIGTGPCLFAYSPRSGVWSVGEGCGPGGAAGGVDNDGNVIGQDATRDAAQAGGRDIIAVAGEGCLLADAAAARGVTRAGEVLGQDREQGFFLVAAPGLVQSGSRRFSCHLSID